MRLRRTIATGIAAVAILGAAVGFGTTKVFAQPPPTCNASSPLLGAYAQYFTFNGVTNGALYQIEARGVWSRSNSARDCIWAQTTYTGEHGQVLWGPLFGTSYITATLYYSPSYNVWYEYSASIQPFTGGPYSVMNDPGMVPTSTAFGADCIVINAEDQYHYFKGPSTLYDGSLNQYTAGVNMPGNNTKLICPT